MPAGRPRKFKNKFEAGVLYEKEEYDKLCGIAKIRGRGVSELIRSITKEWLAEHGTENAPISHWFKDVPAPPIAMPLGNWTPKEWDRYFDTCDTKTLEKIREYHTMVANMAEDHIHDKAKFGDRVVSFPPRWQH